MEELKRCPFRNPEVMMIGSIFDKLPPFARGCPAERTCLKKNGNRIEEIVDLKNPKTVR